MLYSMELVMKQHMNDFYYTVYSKYIEPQYLYIKEGNIYVYIGT